ncbi:PREDICTED: uncharacterized protein LOC109588632 [Amphimedon queenslandica]|uniref:Endonuclease/exonuclease/phosphatase domain-containing protein n=1 Tax=Amphimedon queenslandica TaxID=400682 RepID=A0AAN0JTW7_AMPQE|nr:PREDICTED: uncharacterized protein LOC109588632 [Amphimedon queenslandica]|eukprot:XP_019860338.1 PREDICTED: uncharacterized protein LOC109588632 [Amphimedon queenslandica]
MASYGKDKALLIIIILFIVSVSICGKVKIGRTLGIEHYNCYGNVLGRVSLIPPANNTKLLKIIQKALRTDQAINITIINEMVNYYSTDGHTIKRILYQDKTLCYDPPIEIGRLLTLRYATMATSPASSLLSGIVTIDVDSHKNYYLHSHTQDNHESMSVYERWNFKRNYSKVSECEMCCTIVNQSDWLPVTIATFNIWNVNSTSEEDSKKRLHRLCKVISSIDIIGFQEVRNIMKKSKTISQIHQLHKSLPKHQFVYQPAMLMGLNPREEEGVAIFSRYPIVSTNTILLPWNRTDPSDFHQRVCLHCTIALPNDKKLEVFNTHLSLSEDAQMNSVKTIIKYVQDSDLKGDIIIMGDFNNEDSSTVIKYLDEKLSKLGFVDVWLNNNNNNNNNNNEGNTFCTLNEELTKRIDYIYVQLKSHLYINDTYLIGSKPGSPPLSDHLGLAVQINVN